MRHQKLSPEARRVLIKAGATFEQLLVEQIEPNRINITPNDIIESANQIDVNVLREKLATLCVTEEKSGRAA